MLTAVIHAILCPGKHLIDVDQGEHGEGPDKRASLYRDAAPQQGGVTRFVKQSPNHHLQIGEEAGENNTGDDH